MGRSTSPGPLAEPGSAEPPGARDLQEAAALAHELKNPLTAVKALLQLGLRNPAEAGAHARLALVEREVSRMQAILQRHLERARAPEELAPAVVPLGALVEEALRELAALASAAGVRLSTRGDAIVEADPGRLREALVNLVSNAVEASPPGGEVSVEVRARGAEVELWVRDTGRGMAPETLRRLGTPFFTTRPGGTGLGVVLARAVIARHGGSLRYESEPGKGTTALATLPRRARAA